MTLEERLEDIIRQHYDPWSNRPREIAEAIIAAGWRPTGDDA